MLVVMSIFYRSVLPLCWLCSTVLSALVLYSVGRAFVLLFPAVDGNRS